MRPDPELTHPGVVRRGGRLKSIDVLRGVAILSVLAIHIPHGAPGGWREHPFFLLAFLAEFGYLGVPLFIVISGFCIHRGAALAYAAVGKYDFSWPRFWARRFIRLYPPYVAAIVFSLACAFLLHDKFPDPRQFLGWDLATHLLLIHNLTDEFATTLSNGAFWSLGTEEQLYALYFLLLVLMTRGSAGLALLVAGVVTLAWRLLVPHLPEAGPDLGPFHLGQWFQWPLHYWFHWALGAFAVDSYLRHRVLPAWCRSFAWAVALVAVGLAFNSNTFDFLMDTKLPLEVLRGASEVVLGSLHNLGELAIAAGIFCLLNWSLEQERAGAFAGRLSTMTAGVGRISYSVYLVHMPVVYILAQHLPLGYGPGDWLLRYALYGGICLLVGYAFHLAVEQWFLGGRLPRPWPGSNPMTERGA